MTRRSSSPAHIVALNDSPVLLELLTKLLQEEGYRFSGRGVNTRDFPAIVAAAADVIVLDLPTGNEDTGWVLFQMLKAEPATRSIPVVLCTGAVVDIEARPWLLDSIGVQVVYKPFTLQDVLTAITAALGTAAPPRSGTSGTTSPNGSTDHEPDRD